MPSLGWQSAEIVNGLTNSSRVNPIVTIGFLCFFIALYSLSMFFNRFLYFSIAFTRMTLSLYREQLYVMSRFDIAKYEVASSAIVSGTQM